MKSKLYDAIARTADLNIDEIRLRLNQQPEGERMKEMFKEEAEVNDLTRFESFMKWARENFTTLSVVMISIAGIITTVVVGARSALKKGATATSKFGKAMAKLAKKVGPVLSAALGLIACQNSDTGGKRNSIPIQESMATCTGVNLLNLQRIP